MAADKFSLLLILLGGCARPPAVADSIGTPRPSTSSQPRFSSAEGPSVNWSKFTQSPNPGSVAPRFADLAERCGELDERLSATAAWLAQRGPLGQSADEAEQLTFALRASGSPYVRPAAWTRTSHANAQGDWAELEQEREAELNAMELWLRTQEPSPLRRCGIARGDWQGSSVTAVVVSLALAELVRPLPTRARVGQWLELLAHLHVEADSAKAVLLGPDGDPWTVPTEKSGRSVRARFPAATPGRWMIQLMADVASGPRQVLEALVFVDETPPATYQPEKAPGERATQADESSESALLQMLADLRAHTRRPSLRRDPLLDRAALTHAEAMRRARRIGHDVGSGSTTNRLAAIHFSSRLAGENVAHAADARRVHRALWASPSHRSNLLNRSFSRFGLGVVEDSDHSLWVCELFASED